MNDSIYNQSGGNELAAGRDLTGGGEVIGCGIIKVSNRYTGEM